jgi:hypothetical protein
LKNLFWLPIVLLQVPFVLIQALHIVVPATRPLPEPALLALIAPLEHLAVQLVPLIIIVRARPTELLVPAVKFLQLVPTRLMIALILNVRWAQLMAGLIQRLIIVLREWLINQLVIIPMAAI